MTLFAWDNIYSVGNTIIDAQHQRLFSIANRFHEAHLKLLGREVLMTIFDELIEYTATHFADEERMLQAKGFPDYAEHKRHHEKLIALVLQYKKLLAEGEPGVESRALSFLTTWLNGHILGIDRNYATHIAATPTKKPALAAAT
jgi:hemerythrin-like metal-binding protein